LEGTLKKLAFVASTATALVCAAALIATPADAKRHHKKPAAAAAAGQMAYGPPPGPGGYNAGPMHAGGYPVRSGTQCWKEVDVSHDRGYWSNCPKK
jgi:hypothetical protein